MFLADRATKPASSPPDRGRVAAWAREAAALAAWIEKHRLAGDLHFSSAKTLELSDLLDDKFAVGRFGQRFYVGVPLEICNAFSRIPWSHICVNTRETSLSVVYLSDGAAGGPLPSFALTFRRVSPDLLRFISHYSYVDIRSVEQGAENSVCIGARVLATLPISVCRELHSDESVMCRPDLKK